MSGRRNQDFFFVYADSRNRPAGTSGNSFVLTLTTPIKNVTRVDLVAAKIPNSLYNITQGVFEATGNTYVIPPGFYSAPGLATTVSSLSGIQMSYLQNQGKFIFSSDVTAVSADTQAAFGLVSGNVSVNVVNLVTEEFVFLDIAELRNRRFVDSRTLTGETYGATIATTFAAIPLDVMSGQFKTFKETSDYAMGIDFDQPIDSVSRLTVQWLNKDGQLVNFNGMDTNSFLLRFHCMDPREVPQKEEEPADAVLLKKIQRAVEDAMPPPKKGFPKWILLVILIGAIGLFVLRSKGVPTGR
jgi:hypothetical protein